MFESQNQQSPEPARNAPRQWKIWAVAGVVVLIYLGYIFFTRWQQKSAFEYRKERNAAERAEQDRRTVEGMGGDRFEILQFYAFPAEIKRGDDTQLCYGVSNAKSVTLEPQPHEVWPAFSRCVTVSPRKTTEYTFTATDANGQTKQSKATVEVR